MELIGLLILLVVGILVLGIAGFIISLSNFSKIRDLEGKLTEKGIIEKTEEVYQHFDQSAEEFHKEQEREIKEQPDVYQPEKEKPEPSKQKEPAYFQQDIKPETPKQDKEKGTLEQKIGTVWILVAGILTVLFGVGFFLKYAYENFSISETARVIIAAVGGVIAIGIGEITRRKDYGIVAKATAALGFAILYGSVFAAFRMYELIPPTTAFILSIVITACAMLYAVWLDYVLIAIISLFGGFLSPVILSTGQNLPVPLFIYVLILGTGAIVCSSFRKWRAVNLISFIGTFILYGGWFFKFYDIGADAPQQMDIALTWLTVFYAFYLVIPIFYELRKKISAKAEDVSIIICDSFVTFIFLSLILFNNFRTELAVCSAGLGLINLAMMLVVIKRIPEDKNLRIAFMLLGLAFITGAVPLYFKMYAIPVAWSIESVVLLILCIKYRNAYLKAASVIILLLSVLGLLAQLPLHENKFRLMVNPEFGSWLFVFAVSILWHVNYRNKTGEGFKDKSLSDMSFLLCLFMFALPISLEWYHHIKINLSVTYEQYLSMFYKGEIILIPLLMLAGFIRPICPESKFIKSCGIFGAGVGAVVCMAFYFELHTQAFRIFANSAFLFELIPFAVLFIIAKSLLSRDSESKSNRQLAAVFGLGAVVFLFILLTAEIYSYFYWKDIEFGVPEWKFKAHMYVSFAWVIYGIILMTLGFIKKSRALRYTALIVFALLWLKVFILDTSNVESIYRISALLVTGVTFVGISYFYQFLKKKGYFEALISE